MEERRWIRGRADGITLKARGGWLCRPDTQRAKGWREEGERGREQERGRGERGREEKNGGV